jgi:hypothetical protein
VLLGWFSDRRPGARRGSRYGVSGNADPKRYVVTAARLYRPHPVGRLRTGQRDSGYGPTRLILIVGVEAAQPEA